MHFEAFLRLIANKPDHSAILKFDADGNCFSENANT